MGEAELIVVHGFAQFVGGGLLDIEIGIARGEEVHDLCCAPPAALAFLRFAEGLGNHIL